MPSTVNGIGTRYHGKKNRTARAALCNSCRRVGNLESYDTRLWFVIVFIPVIPLGRKRIIDECPACRRHYVMKADDYEQAKQLQTSGKLEQFRREPSVQSALEAHAQLLAFHEQEQAADFRKTALERFPGHAELRAGMAAQLREMSSNEDAERLFQEALDLDPELPEARIGVAVDKMVGGNLDEARRLLDFLMEPGAARQYSLAPIDSLSGYLQRAGRHEETMEIAGVLLRELPRLEDDHAFRTFVKKSEKALGRTESILPRRPFSLVGLFRSEGSPHAPWQRKLAIGTLAVVLLLGGLAINNEYIRRHRTLHVLNATGQAAQVRVDDQPAVPVSGLGRLTVPEGPHVITVSGPVTETLNVELDSGYLERWTNNPAWIFNLGGEGVLEDIIHVYSTNGTPSRRQLLIGQTFLHRPHVDYIFAAAPGQIKLGKREQDITKTEIGWARADDLQAFLETNPTNHKAAMDFAEKHLKRNPKQANLLNQYVGGAQEAERGRVETFLKSGIDRRPVDVPWHRAYQTVAEVNKHEAELVSLYDKGLAADPANASLLYLRGRIDPDWEKQDGYYRRAIAADPKLGWPWMAIAGRAGAEGNWDDSLKAALKARELNVDEPARIAEMIHEARLAKGEAKALVEPYRAAAAASPQDIPTLLLLVDALAASGREDEIATAISAWGNRVPGPVQGQILPHLTALGLYYAGKLAECAEFCGSSPVVRSTPWHLHALLALGRMEEAAEDPKFAALREDPLNLLAMSVGFGLDGKPEESARWREKAARKLGEVGGATDMGKAAKLLNASEPPSIKDVHQIYLPLPDKTILLAALADRFPAMREVYLAEAARFNVTRKPSYRLIRKIIEKKAPGQP
jgi:tetratricopeptide (TPR) repeat protein